jgi:hypothetical protein
MKRSIVIGLFGFGAAVLLGCPVFSGNNSTGVAPCYGNACGGYYCDNSNPCPSGYSCEDNTCVYGFDSGSDVTNDSPGGCVPACSSGEECAVTDDGGLACVPAGDGGGDASPPFTGCTSNAQCAAADGGAGAICLDGVCTPPDNQCFDGEQCAGNEDCVQGACVPTCSVGATNACPSGYSCVVIGDGGANGVCTGNPSPCGGADGGSACGDGTTCVEQHCVPKCSGGDASCGPGLVCVDNGCIPDQKPVFTCNTNGQAGDGKSGNCDVGSVCLDHSCFISCSPEASTSCEKADMFPVCKAVSTSYGTYYVCGTSSNLGTQCNPTEGKNCTSPQICIDGNCE